MKKGILVIVLLCLLLSALPVLAKETEGGIKQSEEQDIEAGKEKLPEQQNAETGEETGDKAEAGTELLRNPDPVTEDGLGDDGKAAGPKINPAANATASYTLTIPQSIKAGNNGMIYQCDPVGRRVPFQISVKPRGSATLPYNISVRVHGALGTENEFTLISDGSGGQMQQLAYSVCKFDAGGQKVPINPHEEFAHLSLFDPNMNTADGEIVLDDPSTLPVNASVTLNGYLYFVCEAEITGVGQQNIETEGGFSDRSGDKPPLIYNPYYSPYDTHSDPDGKITAASQVSVTVNENPNYTLTIPQTIKSGNSGMIYTSDSIRRRIPFQISAYSQTFESGLYNLAVKVYGDGQSSGGEFELSGDDDAGNRMHLGYSVYQFDASGQKTAVNPHEVFVHFQKPFNPDMSIAKGEIVLDDPSGLNIGQGVTLKGNLIFEAEVVQNDKIND